MATASPEIQSGQQHFEIQYDRTVREEIETFRARAGQFLAGQISEDEFRPFRLKHGIYGQRQPGVQMVRCKIPGGLLTASQAGQLARIADEFAGGRAHLTTPTSPFFFGGGGLSSQLSTDADGFAPCVRGMKGSVANSGDYSLIG